MIEDLLKNKFKGKDCLVTGGAGALGSNLVFKLIEMGAVVTVIDNLSSGYKENLSVVLSKIKFIKGDISSKKDLDKAFESNPKYVFHLAAHFANQNSVDHPYDDLKTNGLATVMILDKCREIKNFERLIYASSSCVLGNDNNQLSENSKLNPETPYGFSKLAGEQYSMFYASEFKLPTTIIRYFNAYGPGEYPGKYRNVVPNFINQALLNKPLNITGTGEETREFVYVDDAIIGTLQASLCENAIGKIFHLGSGQRISINEIAKLIVKLCSSKSEICYFPRRSWDHILHRYTSIEKSIKYFNYCPEIKIEDGLMKAIEWIKSRNIN